MATTSERLELGADELRRRLDPVTLTFQTTEEVEPLEGTIGQPRALAAIEFGLEIETFGYNLFAAGAPGSGRETTVRDYLERYAAARTPPDDWVYVHNFDDPDRPRAIRLPTGRGCELEREEDGSYPEGSVHRLVQDRLRGYAERLREFASVDGLATPVKSSVGHRG